MGCAASKSATVVSSVVSSELIPYDPQGVDTSRTERDEEHYSPEPPERSREQLIPDFGIFSHIDEHSQGLPAQSSVKNLAHQLIACCKTDLDIVRAFYIWICINVKYDDSMSSPNEPEIILKTRLAVCRGYSYLFASLCRCAGIPVKVIRGYSKGSGYDPEKPFTEMMESNHAWNAVYIQREWRLVDVTWGSGTVKGIKSPENFYFLTNPVDMCNDHYPFVNNDIAKSKKWQLLKNPISLTDFNNKVKLSYKALEWGINVKPNLSKMHVCQKAEMEITSSNVNIKNVIIHFKKLGDNDNQNGTVFIRRNPQNEFIVILRPSLTGEHRLSLYIKKENETDYLFMAEVIVNVESVQQNFSPYPNLNSSYGSEITGDRGLDDSMQYCGGFVSPDGTLDVPIRKLEGVKLLANMYHSEFNPDDEQREYISYEVVSETLVIFHLRLRFRGFYMFRVYTLLPSESGDSYTSALQILIECQQPTNKGAFPITYDSVHRLRCKLIEPEDRYIPPNSDLVFKINSQLIVKAKVIFGSENVLMEPSNDTWKCTIRTPSSGTDVVIYGNDITSSLSSLFKFIVK